MKQYDMMFCGHICLDLVPRFPQTGPRKLSQVFIPGKLVEVGAVDVTLGGSVSNSGAAAARLGFRTCIQAKVGRDEFGGLVRSLIQKAGVTENLIEGEGSTSYSVVLSVPGNDRIFLHNTGANDTFGYDDVQFDKVADCRLFHFGYPPLMKRMYQEPEQLQAILKEAKRRGAVTSLDMALPDPDSKAGKANWVDILGKILPFVDIYIPSFEETLLMLDQARYEELRAEAGDRDILDVIDISLLTRLSDSLLELGAGIVAVKCGLKGYYLRTAGAGRLQKLGDLGLEIEEWADRELLCQALEAREFVSSTGAGDSSIAGFLGALLRGGKPEFALRAATTTAWYCLQTVDASSGIPDFAEIEKTAGQDLPQIQHMTDRQGRYDGKERVWLLPKDKDF